LLDPRHRNFAATYQPGHHKFFAQEANLFFNLGFYGFTSGNWSQSAASLTKLTALEEQFSEKLSGVENNLTAQQQQQRVTLPGDKETLELYQFNNIITLATEVLALQLAQSPSDLMQKKQRRHVPLNPVQEVRAKIRMVCRNVTLLNCLKRQIRWTPNFTPDLNLA
jgi:hypothetical protein